jgi:hypothetical protein
MQPSQFTAKTLPSPFMKAVRLSYKKRFELQQQAEEVFDEGDYSSVSRIPLPVNPS